jgi:hypothetical protein
MCKPWPGLRCTDHPHQRIQKLSAQIHKKNAEITEIDERINEVHKEYGDDAVNQEEHQALVARKDKVLNTISELDEKRALELCSYSMSAGGRKELEEITQNETVSAEDRLNAAAELEVAQKRVGEQRQMGKILNDDELTPQDKLAYFQVMEKVQAMKRTRLEAAVAETQERLQAIDYQIQIETAEGNKEALTILKREKASLAIKRSIQDKELKQRQALDQEMKRYREKIEQKWVKGVERNTKLFLNVVNWLLKPRRA